VCRVESRLLNWPKNPTVVALAVAAAVVVLAGMLTFQLGAPDAVAELSSQAVAPDAVQQVLRAGKPTLIEFGANRRTAHAGPGACRWRLWGA